jgi:hypothetical protein
MSTTANTLAASHGKSRAVTFADWQAAARSGYIAGGANPYAATAIVNAAASDIAPMLTCEMTPMLITTFVLLLDLECGRYVRRHGAAFFSARD